MALNAQGTRSKIEQALQVLHEASLRDPKNTQLLFQRAHILFTRGDLEAALSALEQVVQAAPKEPPVHAMMGQIYQRLGMFSKSLFHLNIALDLDPKEANNIKVSVFLYLKEKFYDCSSFFLCLCFCFCFCFYLCLCVPSHLP